MRAGTLLPFVVRTRSSQVITSQVTVAHLWWLSKGRCSQSQFKQRLCLKWHRLYRGNEWGFDLSLAPHENSCTWDSALDHIQKLHLHLTKSAPRIHLTSSCLLLIFLWKLLISYIAVLLLLALISYSSPLNKAPPLKMFLFQLLF